MLGSCSELLIFFWEHFLNAVKSIFWHRKHPNYKLCTWPNFCVLFATVALGGVSPNWTAENHTIITHLRDDFAESPTALYLVQLRVAQTLHVSVSAETLGRFVDSGLLRLHQNCRYLPTLVLCLLQLHWSALSSLEHGVQQASWSHVFWHISGLLRSSQ